MKRIPFFLVAVMTFNQAIAQPVIKPQAGSEGGTAGSVLGGSTSSGTFGGSTANGAAGGRTASGSLGGRTAGGAFGGAEGQGGITQTSSFPGCPFALDMAELVPPTVQADFEALYTRMQADPDCRTEGANIGQLLQLMGLRSEPGGSRPPVQPVTPTGPTTTSGGKSSGAEAAVEASLVSPQPQPRNPGTGFCADAARCEQLIVDIIESARGGQNSSCYRGNAVDTILGVAFSLGNPGIGQVALGVSAIRSVIGLFSSARRNPGRDMSQFFNREVPRRQMETLQACYATTLFKDSYCRDSYIDCLTGSPRAISENGFCGGATLSQSGAGSQSAGPICRAYADAMRGPNPGSTVISYEGRDYGKQQLLELCLKDLPGGQNLSGDQFLIDTSVMSEIYACMSYWTKAHVKRNPGAPLSSQVLDPIRRRCMDGKLTKGEAPINTFTLEYNKLRHLQNAPSNDFVRDELLPPVLQAANTFHERQIREARYQDGTGVHSAVLSCYHGYGISLANRSMEQRNANMTVGGGDSTPARCQSLNACVVRGMNSSPEVTMPLGDASLYSGIVPIESLNDSFLTPPAPGRQNPNRNNYSSNVGKVCYGMAMNDFLDHTYITSSLRGQGFDGRSCTRPPAPRDDADYLGTDFGPAPTSGQ